MEIRSISSAAMLRASLVVFGVLVALRFLWLAHAIFVIAFLGVLLGLAMSPAVDVLERMRVRRGVGAPLTLLTGLGVLTIAGFLIGPPLHEQSGELSQKLPQALQSVDAWLNRTPAKALVPPQPNQGQPGAGPAQQQARGITAELTREFRGATKFLFPLVSSFFGAVGGIIIVLFIAMYISADPHLYRKGVLHLVPHRHRERASEVLATLRDTLRQWLLARLIAMVLIGVITGAGLALLQVKGAAALGLLAGLLEFVPFFGPIAGAVPAVAVALVDSPEKALWVAGLYVLVQQLEGNIITPLLLEKRLDIPPVLTVLSVAALGVVFGIIGMLIAEPLLAAVLVTTKMLYVSDVVGDQVKIGKSEA